MHLVVRAFPVLPGREQAMTDAFNAMRVRSEETLGFYARHGVAFASEGTSRRNPAPSSIVARRAADAEGDDVVANP